MVLSIDFRSFMLRKSLSRIAFLTLSVSAWMLGSAEPGFAQSASQKSAPGQLPALSRDPAEPLSGKPHPKIIARPAGRLSRQAVDEKGMRSLISDLVKCGTRLTLAAWDDPKRGPGCARDHIAARLNTISKETGGKLQVVVDKFEMT